MDDVCCVLCTVWGFVLFFNPLSLSVNIYHTPRAPPPPPPPTRNEAFSPHYGYSDFIYFTNISLMKSQRSRDIFYPIFARHEEPTKRDLI